MQVVVAFILEAFVFRIQYRMVMNGQDMSGTASLIHSSFLILFLLKHIFCQLIFYPIAIHANPKLEGEIICCYW